MTFAKAVLQYYSHLTPPTNIPSDVVVMNPFKNPETFRLASKFYNKFYNDDKSRFICFGINPGRFGAGLTGVPFTDPIKLENECGINNNFDKRAELSSSFIYEMIQSFGGINQFYKSYYLSAISPLGYIRNNINLNYYDIKGYKKLFEEYVVDQIEQQLNFNIDNSVAYSIGKGKNADFLNFINDRYGFFDKIIQLPHPRWIMQYRLKRKKEFILEYLSAFN